MLIDITYEKKSAEQADTCTLCIRETTRGYVRWRGEWVKNGFLHSWAPAIVNTGRIGGREQLHSLLVRSMVDLNLSWTSNHAAAVIGIWFHDDDGFGWPMPACTFYKVPLPVVLGVAIKKPDALAVCAAGR